MFGFGKRQEAVTPELAAPVTGTLMPLAKVADPVFAGGMMGTGYAVEPTDGRVVAPISGKVTMVAPHAIGLQRADGVDVLIHVGIDTVNLAGAPFELAVSADQTVNQGDVLVIADLAAIEAAEYAKTVMVLVVNTADTGQVAEVTAPEGAVAAGQVVAQTVKEVG